MKIPGITTYPSNVKPSAFTSVEMKQSRNPTAASFVAQKAIFQKGKEIRLNNVVIMNEGHLSMRSTR